MLHKIKLICIGTCHGVNQRFKSITLNFAFMFIFMNLFQLLFGPENSIVGVDLIIIMQSSMLLDFTVHPVKNFFSQLLILEAMTISAFLINVLPPFITIPMNCLLLFVLLYTFTFEYASDLYMPYILSYLFLIFISPVSAQSLPKRMLAVLAGTICVILYHFFRGSNRTKNTVREALTGMIDEATGCIQCLILGEGMPDSIETVRNNLYKLSHLVYERRKHFLYISDASSAMLDCGLKLENLIGELYDFEGIVSPQDAAMLNHCREWLSSFRAAIQGGKPIELPDGTQFSLDQHGLGERVYNSLVHMQNRWLRMTDFGRRLTFRPALVSWVVKIKTALNASPVRIVYSVRVAILLSLLTALVMFLHLPHGKWLLFTVASVSLPYADDVGTKAKKRFLATMLGGGIAVIAFALVPSVLGRTAIMLFFGYMTAYFSDYRLSFACSTIGGLGGAMLTNCFGWADIGGVFLVRLGYICVGIAIAYAANCLVLPFKRSAVMQQQIKTHVATKEMLACALQDKTSDLQLYYNLVVHTLLQEEQLKEGFHETPV